MLQISSMGRRKRAYLPGTFFHLIGRTQARIHWFDDWIKDRILEIVADAVEESDVALNAFVIMNNHFHLLARQGDAPLAAFMQPVMRRIALLLKSTLQLEDHVFGRRYWDRSCRDIVDLRTCIRYLHRNPVHASCCSDPSDYPWSSHHAYMRVLEPGHWRPRLDVLRGIFATGSCRSETELCADYLRFVSDDDNAAPSASASLFAVADARWRDLLAWPNRLAKPAEPRKRRDLRDIVQQTIAELCPELDLEMVRTFRGAWLRQVRVELVRRATRAGYPGCQIARYLHMHESQVSRIIRSMPAYQRTARWQR